MVLGKQGAELPPLDEFRIHEEAIADVVLNKFTELSDREKQGEAEMVFLMGVAGGLFLKETIDWQDWLVQWRTYITDE